MASALTPCDLLWECSREGFWLTEGPGTATHCLPSPVGLCFGGFVATCQSSNLQNRKAVRRESTLNKIKNNFALTFEVSHLSQALRGEFASRCFAGVRVRSPSTPFLDCEPRAWQVSKVC